MAKLKEVIINPNKVAIYVRWSTDAQETGTTLEVQLNACKNYLLSQGWNVNEDLIFIDEGFSGANLNRPEVTRLREYVQQKKVECIIVYKLDRLSRSLKDAVVLVLDEWDELAYLKSVTEPIDTTTALGLQIMYLLFSFSELERTTIKERTWSGKLTRAREGKNAGFRPAYGYISELGNPGNFITVPEEIEIVKRIYNLYLENWGVRRIVELFNSNGIKFRGGKLFNTSTVYYILGNPIYYSCMMYGRHSQDSKWRLANEPLTNLISDYIEPAITKETFDRVQELKHKKNVNVSGVSGRTYRSQHLLTGLLFCRNCAHALGGLKPSTGRSYFYYTCKGYHTKGRAFCDAANIQQDILDKLVVEDMKKYFFPEENRLVLIEKLSGKYEQDIKNCKSELSILINEEIKIKKQLAKIEKDYLTGDLDVKKYNILSDKLINEMSINELFIREKEVHLEKLKSYIIDPNVINDSANILLNWDDYSIEDKKLFLSFWVVTIKVYKSKDKNINNGEIIFEPTYIWDIEKEGI